MGKGKDKMERENAIMTVRGRCHYGTMNDKIGQKSRWEAEVTDARERSVVQESTLGSGD